MLNSVTTYCIKSLLGMQKLTTSILLAAFLSIPFVPLEAEPIQIPETTSYLDFQQLKDVECTTVYEKTKEFNSAEVRPIKKKANAIKLQLIKHAIVINNYLHDTKKESDLNSDDEFNQIDKKVQKSLANYFKPKTSIKISKSVNKDLKKRSPKRTF